MFYSGLLPAFLFLPFIFCPFIFSPDIFLSDLRNLRPQTFGSNLFSRRMVFLKSLFRFFHFVSDVRVKVRSRTTPKTNQRPLRILSLSIWSQRQGTSITDRNGKSVEFALRILLFLCKRIICFDPETEIKRDILARMAERRRVKMVIKHRNPLPVVAVQ